MTDISDRVLSRRSAFAALGAGTLAAAAVAAPAEAAMNSVEEANLKLCQAVLASRSGTAVHSQQLAAYLADTCVLRLDDAKQTVIGKQQVSAVFQDFSAAAEITATTHSSFAKGSLVVIQRSDMVVYKDPAVAPKTFAVAGVFTVEGGKIQQWFDLVLDTKSAMV